jgi:hypothetical protein
VSVQRDAEGADGRRVQRGAMRVQRDAKDAEGQRVRLLPRGSCSTYYDSTYYDSTYYDACSHSSSSS